jgi:ketosteroid isomerase-like protein
MSDDNVENARQAYAALNARDFEAFLALVDPDVEFRSLIAESEGQTYRGHEGVREWWEGVRGSLGGLSFETRGIREVGDGLVTEIIVTGEVGGVAVPQRMWQALRFRNGRAAWWHTYRSEQEALDAVGLAQ